MVGCLPKMHKALNSIPSTETNRRGNTHELMVVYLIFNPTMSFCYYLAPIPPCKIPWASKLKTFSKLHGKTVCSLRLCDLYVLWSGWTPVSEAGELLLVSCINQRRRKSGLPPDFWRKSGMELLRPKGSEKLSMAEVDRSWGG